MDAGRRRPGAGDARPRARIERRRPPDGRRSVLAGVRRRASGSRSSPAASPTSRTISRSSRNTSTCRTAAARRSSTPSPRSPRRRNTPSSRRRRSFSGACRRAAQFNYEFVAWKPERVAAFVVNKGGIYYTALAPKAAREVPGLLFIGEKDLDSRINMISGLAALNRRGGALWALTRRTGRRPRRRALARARRDPLRRDSAAAHRRRRAEADRSEVGIRRRSENADVRARRAMRRPVRNARRGCRRSPWPRHGRRWSTTRPFESVTSGAAAAVARRHRRQRLRRPRRGDQAEARRHRRFRHSRTCRRRRRNVARQHLSRLRVRRRVASLLAVVRARAWLDLAILASARDLALSPAPRARPRSAVAHPLPSRGATGRVGCRRARLADRHLAGDAWRRARWSSPPVRSARRRYPTCQGSTPSRAARFTRRTGTTTTISPASASPSSAPARQQSSSSRRSGSAPRGSRSFSARRHG